jgi:NADH-quinone oxidoreductase subunit N
MFLKDPEENDGAAIYNLAKPFVAMVGIAVVATVGSVFFVQPLISYIFYMVSASGY